MLPRFFPLAPILGALGASIALGLTGCGDSQAPPTEREREAIIGGELSPAGIEDAVLLLRSVTPEGGERLCGASLVAENLVVTARHCAAYVTAGPFLCTKAGELVEGSPGAGRMGLDLPAEVLEFYANDSPRTEPVALGARVVSTLSDSACSDDLAFVVLDRAVDLPILPLRRGRPALEDEAVVAVGYGVNESVDQIVDYETQKRRRKTGLRVAAVGPDTSETVGPAPPRIVIVDGTSACLGDSGGPLLAQGTNALLAVHSLIEGDCVGADARSWFTHLPPLWPWAERAFEAAGATPTLEPDPIDGPCTNDGCAGAGTGGSAAGGAGVTEPGGSGGAPPDPGDPKPDPNPTREPPAKRDSGCALGRARDRNSPLASIAAVLLAALVRRAARARTQAGTSA